MRIAVVLFAFMVSYLQWQEKASMPQPRAGYMAGAISRRLLLAGGSYWLNGKKYWSERADIFDPVGNVWTATAPLPERRSDAACAAVADKFYLFGGGSEETVRTDALVYERGKWRVETRATLPEPRLYSVAVAHQGKIYLTGGISKAGNYRSASNQLWVWDTTSGQGGWTALPPMPGPARFTHAMAALVNNLYVFGGATSEGDSVRNLADAYRFDLRTNVWTRLHDLPFARRAWSAMPSNGRIFLLGGYTADYERETYSFDPSTQQLKSTGMLPHPLAAAIFVTVGKQLIVAGGETADHVRAPSTVIGTIP